MKEVSTVAVFHDGKLLMGKRRDNHKFTCPGGHLEPGEDPRVGAVRELFEEAGIHADLKELTHLKSKLITKKDGEQLKVHAYRLDLGDRAPTSMKQDPDGEVHRWHWFSADALPSPLHVPFEHSVLLQALGDEVSMRKVAFWSGFEKAAGLPATIMPKLIPLAKQSLGQKAVGMMAAHPKTTLGLAAAGTFGAGRASKS